MSDVIRWTRHDLCALQEATGLTNERFADRIKMSVRTVAAWRRWREEILPANAQRTLTQALSEAGEEARRRFVDLRAMPGRWDTQEDAVLAAADEADADDMILATELDPTSVADLWSETQALARVHSRPAVDVFTAARKIRGNARELVDHTRRPGLLSDLYVIIGQATALMASTAFDLRRWDASARLAQSAASYAGIAGHQSLQAWTLGLRATLANWRDEPDLALTYYEKGLRLAPAGAPRFRLRYIAARSHALLGDASGVTQDLVSAVADREDSNLNRDALSEETGGEFAFGQARAEACAAAAWLDLGGGSEAETHAQQALDELTAAPGARQPFSQVNGARIDLAAARLISGNRDGGADALRPVLDLPMPLRNVSLAGRMERVRQVLAGPRWRTDDQAAELAGQVGEWLTEATALR
jgi:hypothetical protein